MFDFRNHQGVDTTRKFFEYGCRIDFNGPVGRSIELREGTPPQVEQRMMSSPGLSKGIDLSRADFPSEIPSGEMTTVITGNTIRNLVGASEDGIDVTYNAGSANTTIQGNVVANADVVNSFGDGIAVAINTTGSTSTIIGGNTIGQLNNGLFDDGIEVLVSQGIDHAVAVSNNLVGQLGGLFDDGIQLRLAGGAATFVAATIQNNLLLASTGPGVGLNAIALAPANLCADVTGNLTHTALTFTSGFGASIDIVDLPTLSANNFFATTLLFPLGTIQNAVSCPP